VVGTTIHEDFFDPWLPTTAKDIRTKAYHTTPPLPHPMPWTAPRPRTKSEKKRKEKPCLGISSNKSCRYTKPPVQTFIYKLLFYIQARRTGFAALKWQAILGKDFEIFLQLF